GSARRRRNSTNRGPRWTPSQEWKLDWESARSSRTRRDALLTAAMLASLVTVLLAAAGCASMGGYDDGGRGGLIASPFADSAWLERQARDRVIFRSKKGSRALEVELPADQQNFSNFAMPMAPE